MLDGRVPEKQSNWNLNWDCIHFAGPHPRFLAFGDLMTMGNGSDVVLGVRGRVGDASISGKAGTSRHSGSWKSSRKRMSHGFVKSC